MSNPSSSPRSDDQSSRRKIVGDAGSAKRAVFIFVSSLALLTLWATCGSMAFYERVIAPAFPSLGDSQTWSAIYRFTSATLLLGLAPALIVRFGLGEPLSDFGCQLGIRLFTVRSFLVMAPLLILLAYLASADPEIRAYYPLNQQAGKTASLTAHLISYAFFYLAWEFHFRGFLQFGLADSIGRTKSIFLQVALSTGLHVGTPSVELSGALLAGIYWGLLAFRAKSIVSGTLQHMLIGLTLDLLLIFVVAH
jgi:hypothetical protein